MLKDLDKHDWLPLLNLSADRIPRALILRGTRNLKKKFHEHQVYFDNIVEVHSQNGVVEDVFVGDFEGMPVAYASVYGAPMAAEVAHIFGVLGTELVIQTGCCGGIDDDVDIGDIVCAMSAFCGEGASQYYLDGESTVKADSDLIDRVNSLISEAVPVHYGPIYTTSALFAESAADIARWSEQGYVAVDIETAATFAVAKHFDMDYLSLLYVFDNPRTEEHLLTADGENDKKRAEGELVMLGMVLTIIEAAFVKK
ncbi:MAG: nucleoside phosphorylase [bacterium]|nr:nucleoside phosphorylase [bacterium]